MLSNWKKSASADRAQSAGSSHRTNIGAEAGPGHGGNETEHRVPTALSHLFKPGRVLAACSVVGYLPLSPW